jgi:predicted nucleic acid-binding protein
MVVSSLVRVEVPAAIWRKHRIGEIRTEEAGLLVSEFEADYHGADGEPERFAVVGVSELILIEAARQVAAHQLRGYDAVQLSSGILARRADADCAWFACFDEELREAAAVEGFRLVPVGSSQES